MNTHGMKPEEVAKRRRQGASRQHSEKVKAHMLSQADLYTTCPRCHQRVKGNLTQINQHVEDCHGD